MDVLDLDLHNTRKVKRKVSKSGVIQGLHASPFHYSYKIAMPVYEIRWPRFVKDTEVHTESDAPKCRNEIRKT